MSTGALLLQTEGGFVEAPRLDTDVVINVNGTIARTVVTQRFEGLALPWRIDIVFSLLILLSGATLVVWQQQSRLHTGGGRSA